MHKHYEEPMYHEEPELKLELKRIIEQNISENTLSISYTDGIEIIVYKKDGKLFADIVVEGGPSSHETIAAELRRLCGENNYNAMAIPAEKRIEYHGQYHKLQARVWTEYDADYSVWRRFAGTTIELPSIPQEAVRKLMYVIETLELIVDEAPIKMQC